MISAETTGPMFAGKPDSFERLAEDLKRAKLLFATREGAETRKFLAAYDAACAHGEKAIRGQQEVSNDIDAVMRRGSDNDNGDKDAVLESGE